MRGDALVTHDLGRLHVEDTPTCSKLVTDKIHIENPYLRDTGHRTGGELVDEGEGLLRLVGHGGRPVNLREVGSLAMMRPERLEYAPG